jgi:hypothetical protein
MGNVKDFADEKIAGDVLFDSGYGNLAVNKNREV